MNSIKFLENENIKLKNELIEIKEILKKNTLIDLEKINQIIKNEVSDTINKHIKVNLETVNVLMKNEIKEILNKNAAIDLEKINQIIKNEVSETIHKHMNVNLETINVIIHNEIKDILNKNINFESEKTNHILKSEIKNNLNKNVFCDLNKITGLIKKEIKDHLNNNIIFGLNNTNNPSLKPSVIEQTPPKPLDIETIPPKIINDVINTHTKTKMICDLTNINELVKNEKLDICVISYGGSCSNQLVDVLEMNGFSVKTPIWSKILCHCPQYIDLDIPIIYIYSNPIHSFLSVKRRTSYWVVNQQKLSNNLKIELSDETLLKLMIKQFNTWINVKKDNVLILKSTELFNNDIVNKLQSFLKKNLTNFPVKYVTPKTDINNLDREEKKLFSKYKTEINNIIHNFLQN